jgi:phosphohistidine phosphatase SixA
MLNKTSHLILWLVTLSIFSCKDLFEKKIIPDLVTLNQLDSLIIAPNEPLKFTANTPANYKIIGKISIPIDTSGLFKTPQEGIYKVVAINQQNVKDSLVQTIFVLNQAKILTAIKGGGHVLSFRHAAAQDGSDQTGSSVANWWKSCDRSLARQITPSIGYPESDSTGQVFKKLRIPFDTLMTSEYCRCRQTLENFRLNLPIKELKELTYYVYDENNRYPNMMKLYQSKPINKFSYVAVGHAALAGAPEPLASLNWGDCVVYKITPGATIPMVVGKITVREWCRLAKLLQ